MSLQPWQALRQSNRRSATAFDWKGEPIFLVFFLLASNFLLPVAHSPFNYIKQYELNKKVNKVVD